MKILINEVKVRSVRGEKNDCSVIAIMAVTGCTYKQAWEALRSVGRLNGEGATQFQMIRAIKSLGWGAVGFTPLGNVTLAKVAKDRSKGRIIAYTSNHAIAIKDGAIYNAYPIHGKTLIKGFIEITEAA
jgi:hypothetical protein